MLLTIVVTQRVCPSVSNDLVKSKAYRVRVITTIKNKWPQAPTKITELEQFLRDKNIEVDAIGTSEADVQAWIKTLEDCR